MDLRSVIVKALNNYAVQKYRDVLKNWTIVGMEDEKAAYLILGIEEQTNIHYAMPVRAMLYDALQYAKQVGKAAQSYKKKGSNVKLETEEFLSGFRKTDRLVPVITQVVYFGAEEWDAPVSISEMLQIENPEILPFVQDYKIHLLAPIRIKDEEFLKFKSGLGASLMCIKHSKDKEFDILKHPIYETIDIKTARLIKAIANMKFKLEDYQKEGGTMNMCEAYRRSQEKARDEGRLDGLREGTMNGRLMDIKNLMDSFQLTAEQAMDALKIPKEERASYLEKL